MKKHLRFSWFFVKVFYTFPSHLFNSNKFFLFLQDLHWSIHPQSTFHRPKTISRSDCLIQLIFSGKIFTILSPFSLSKSGDYYFVGVQKIFCERYDWTRVKRLYDIQHVPERWTTPAIRVCFSHIHPYDRIHWTHSLWVYGTVITHDTVC